MKSMAKKMVVFTMVGIMQIGFGASVMEASPLHDYYPPVQSYDGHDRDHMERERHERMERERHERERIENERHEREMRRRDHESRREWRERQRIENERHDEAMRRIAHDFADIIFDR